MPIIHHKGVVVPLINWDKPKKLRSTAKHNAMHVSDSYVLGTYVPNTSERDRRKWKGKITQVTTSPQVEIRKDSFVVIVGLKGYTYKGYHRLPQNTGFGRGPSTKGLNIHIASAGPIQMSFKVWEEFIAVVAEAKQTLVKLQLEQDLKKILNTRGRFGHSFNKKGICVRCGMSSIYARFFRRPCSCEGK